MRIVPDSTITLYSGVEVDDGEQLAFSSVQGQNAYFATKLVAQQVPCTVVRKTGTLRVEIAGSVVSGCNYLSFINPSFDNKKIYAHITDYEYVNNECVEIAYEIDAWQTWMFDVTYQPCFIDREHLSQSDWQLAETNPYNPNILELKTSESLPTGADAEKVDYSIGTSQNDDGARLADFLTNIPDSLGVLIKVSDIDFKSLDDAVSPSTISQQAPGMQFLMYLESVITNATGMGFFTISQDTYDYLHTKYGSTTTWNNAFPDSTTGRYQRGSAWGTVYPFYGSSYRPSVTYIYDAQGAEQTGTSIGFFLRLMTTMTGGDPNQYIIDMSLIPARMMYMGGRLDNGQALTNLSFGIRSGVDINVVNHKLKRFPYCYGRLITPNGDIKEFKFEDFINIQGGGTQMGATAYFTMVLDISDKPTLIIAPKNYRMEGINSENANVLEGVFFAQFPTLPYTIDAFEAQVAAVANATIANRTSEAMVSFDVQRDQAFGKGKYASFAGEMLNLIGNAASVGTAGALGSLETAAHPNSIGSAMGSAIGGTGAMLSAVPNLINYGIERKGLEQTTALQYARYKDAGQSLTPGASEIASQMAFTKAAYACNKYYPSNGIGTSNFTVLSFYDVIALKVMLHPTLLSVYDDYFTYYGYNSGRCGIPRVVEYVTGGSDLPHWMQVGNQYITYVKTMDLKITHSLKPVANAIKAMFDNGVRFIKGD